MDAGWRRGAAPGIASEVEDAGGRSAILFPRSGPRSLHAVVPAAGHRFDNEGKVTYEPLQIGFLAPASTGFNAGFSFLSARILGNNTVEFQSANGGTAVSTNNTTPT